VLLSFIIPTRDRPDQLAETLDRLGKLASSVGEHAELIVIDNASVSPMTLPVSLPNGIEVISIQLDQNRNTAARNIGAKKARADWLVMLDDDSSPLECPLIPVLQEADDDLAAIGGEILLPSGKRESGGLPEVIIGCGCAIRRDAFLEVGGYDESFGYYAEEYDLCAKLIGAGFRISHTRTMKFEHRKSTTGRNLDEIIFRLVRNNAWVLQRYAPREHRQRLIDDTIERYRSIAEKENALAGFECGYAELLSTLDQQPERALSIEHWERFEGRAAVRATMQEQMRNGHSKFRFVGPEMGKGRDVIMSELLAQCCTVNNDKEGRAFISTLSPGPMLDSLEAHPTALVPWCFADSGHRSQSAPA